MIRTTSRKPRWRRISSSPAAMITGVPERQGRGLDERLVVLVEVVVERTEQAVARGVLRRPWLPSRERRPSAQRMDQRAPQRGAREVVLGRDQPPLAAHDHVLRERI